jgi:hypothetical protein
MMASMRVMVVLAATILTVPVFSHAQKAQKAESDAKALPQVESDGKPVHHPEVVWLDGGDCSGVIVGAKRILTARHCAVSGVVTVQGDSGTLGKLDEWLGERPEQDLELWSVKWKEGVTPPSPAVLPDAPVKDGQAIRLVAYGKPNEATKAGASGHVEDEACTGPADVKKWGCTYKGVWVAQLTEGRACHKDSGGGVFRKVGGTSVLTGILTGPVTGTASKNEPYKITGGCSAGGLVLGLDKATVEWIKKPK